MLDAQTKMNWHCRSHSTIKIAIMSMQHLVTLFFFVNNFLFLFHIHIFNTNKDHFIYKTKQNKKKNEKKKRKKKKKEKKAEPTKEKQANNYSIIVFDKHCSLYSRKTNIEKQINEQTKNTKH